MGQKPLQQSSDLAQMDKAPERRLPGVAAETLLRRRNPDGFLSRLEFKFFGHRLVSRSRVAFGCSFLHKSSLSQTVALLPTELLRLSLTELD